MKTVLILGGPAAGQQIEVHGTMRSVFVTITPTHSVLYHLAPMCSHGEVHWFGVLDGADPLALLIAGYAPGAKNGQQHADARPTPVAPPRDIVGAPTSAPIGVGMRAPSRYGTGGVKEGDDR